MLMLILIFILTTIVGLIITFIVKIQASRARKDISVDFSVPNKCEKLHSQPLCADMADICQWNPLLETPKCTEITRTTGLGARGETLERSASQF